MIIICKVRISGQFLTKNYHYSYVSKILEGNFISNMPNYDVIFFRLHLLDSLKLDDNNYFGSFKLNDVVDFV